MISHSRSNGQACSGCPDTCEDRNIPIVINGIECRGCCAMRGGPHGTFAFDADGNVTQEPRCCAGYDHATKMCDPDQCGGHGGKPEWAVKVRGPKVTRDALGQKRAEARANKVGAALDALNGVTDRANEHAAIVAKGKVFRGGLRLDDTGELEAEVVVMEKRVNPHNPEAGGVEWHHRAPSASERAQVEASLRSALGTPVG